MDDGANKNNVAGVEADKKLVVVCEDGTVIAEDDGGFMNVFAPPMPPMPFGVGVDDD